MDSNPNDPGTEASCAPLVEQLTTERPTFRRSFNKFIPDSIKRVLKKSPYSVYQSYKLHRLEWRGCRIIDAYISSHLIRKLQIGCGGVMLEGWLNSDLIPNSEASAFLDASRRFPMPDNSFDYIYSEHLFEHLTFVQQLNYLIEANRVLRPGGKIRIATPNFDFLINLTKKGRSVLESRYLAWNFDHFLKNEKRIFADEENLDVYVVNNYFRDWGHQLIHNLKSLEKMVSFAGFTVIDRPPVSASTDPHLRNLEHHGGQISDDFNVLETMIIEAEKP